MIVRHSLKCKIKCPNDDNLIGYTVVIEVERFLLCEDIIGAVDSLAQEPQFQEDFTAKWLKN